jgi:hypothetical protein
MRITIADVRKAGYCISGARKWFADHGLDFNHFVKHGIDSEEFLSKGDAHAQRVIELKVQRGG